MCYTFFEGEGSNGGKSVGLYRGNLPGNGHLIENAGNINSNNFSHVFFTLPDDYRMEL